MDSTIINAENLLKAQNFYSTSFNQIQCSYQIFIAMAAAILAGFALFGIFFNRLDAKRLKELKEEMNNVKKELKEFENKINEITKDHVKRFFIETINSHFKLAKIYISIKNDEKTVNVDNLQSHFSALSRAFSTLSFQEINFESEIKSSLETLESFINNDYKFFYFEHAKDFLIVFENFVKYCRTKKVKDLEYVEKIAEALKEKQKNKNENR